MVKVRGGRFGDDDNNNDDDGRSESGGLRHGMDERVGAPLVAWREMIGLSQLCTVAWGAYLAMIGAKGRVESATIPACCCSKIISALRQEKQEKQEPVNEFLFVWALRMRDGCFGSQPPGKIDSRPDLYLWISVMEKTFVDRSGSLRAEPRGSF